MKSANGVEEGNSGLETTLFTHQLGSPSQPGGRGTWEDWYLRLLSVGSLVSGLETAGGAGVCCEFREHSVGLVGQVVVSWVNSPSGVQRKISLGGTSNAK